MNAKNYLDTFYELNKKIDAKQKELDKLNRLLYVLNRPLTPDKVQTSKTPDPMAETVAKIVDLQSEINKLIDEYADSMREIINVIEQVTDPKEYDLLHKHYVQGLSWTYISKVWDNSNTWVHEVKKSALQSVQKILDKKSI